jgi:hypothetical protein
VRSETGEIKEISDGIVFPILPALSRLVKQNAKTGRWEIHYPRVFHDEDMVIAARNSRSVTAVEC